MIDGLDLRRNPAFEMVFGGWDGSVLEPIVEDSKLGHNWDRVDGPADYELNVHFFEDIPGCQDQSLQTLTSQRDWRSLSFNFRLTSEVFDDGRIQINNLDDPEVVITGLVDPFTVQPLVDAGPVVIISEGDFYVQDITITDPHSATWDVTIDYGDGTSDNFPDLGTSTVITDHLYADNPPGEPNGFFTVTDDVFNVHCAVFPNPPECTVTDTLTVTVNNVAPTVTAEADLTTDEGTEIVNSAKLEPSSLSVTVVLTM